MNVTKNEVLLYLTNRLKELEKESDGIRSAIASLGKSQENGVQSKQTDVPVRYSKTMNMKEKILFALNKIGNGFAADVHDVVAEYEPEKKGAKLLKTIGVRLSDYYRDGIIGARRVGRRYEYYLLED